VEKLALQWSASKISWKFGCGTRERDSRQKITTSSSKSFHDSGIQILLRNGEVAWVFSSVDKFSIFTMEKFGQNPVLENGLNSALAFHQLDQ